MKPNRTCVVFASSKLVFRHCLFLCLLAGAASNSSLAGKPVSGRVVGWNYNAFVPNDPPPNLTNIIAVSAAAAGNYYSQNLALRDDGTVVAWGKNGVGQTETNVPAGLIDVVVIAAGADHYLALKSDGTVVSWEGTSIFPVPASVTNVAAIASGWSGYNLALTKDGGVISWTNGAANYALPSGLDSNVLAIAAAPSFLALKSDGTVVAWGLNNLGQTNVPSGMSNLTSVAVDYIHSLGLKNDGTVLSWGVNWDGQTNVPTGLSNVVAVAAGGVKGSHNLVLKNDGTVLTWGAGQTNIPAGLSNVVAIAAGDYYNLAVVADLRISDIDFSNQKPAIHFHTFTGQNYSVEYSSDISSGNWTPLIQSNLQGTGGDMVVTDTNAASVSRFYRLKQW